ncbi:MAG: response regulator [Ignavibacteriae bacterium]|nr:response regulator [Ignavibacteriota bacterium]
MNLLVVDDDSVVRMSMRTLLTSEGHSVCTAADGEDALAKLASHTFDMIISDVYMPNMDGVRLRNVVREIPDKRSLPFLFISGYDDQSTIDMIRNPKLEGFFKKGRPLSELLSWITYLTTPEHKRSTFPPTLTRDLASDQQHGRVQRGSSRVPLL